MKLVNIVSYSLALVFLLMLGCDNNNHLLANAKNEQITTDHDVNYLTKNISVSKKLKQIPPYIMYAYGTTSNFSGGQYYVYIHTTAFEEMDYDDEKLIFGVMFISNGDLHEEPLALYIHGERNPDMLSPPTFCKYNTQQENTLIIYASHKCNAKQPPDTETLKITLDPISSIISVEDKELHVLGL